MTIEEANALDEAQFVAAFGFLFEHSPWVVERAAVRRPFADSSAMEAAMRAVVAASGREGVLSILRAHPELAGKAAIDRTLTEASLGEQASAGLDRLTEAEFARFHALNAAYAERFGFPFVICVRLTDKAGILAAMETRLTHGEDEELVTAIGEVHKIVHLRLTDRLEAAA
ncbi:MAG TPA: 2-oxo-4-hydroxy-4-carboxy-5-ureidoimidazoline decarboxylase [Sphingobium sp.]